MSGDTKVVSTASWLPPHIGSPLAMTSIRRSSTLDRFWMLRSASRVLVVTLAPPSLQMRAAALSRGPPLDRKTPD